MTSGSWPTRLAVAATAIGVWIAFAGAALSGTYVDDPCPVPKALKASRADYDAATAKFRALKAEVGPLDSTAAAFNSRCNVERPVGSPEEVKCAAEQSSLSATLTRHDDAVKAYHQWLAGRIDALLPTIAARMPETRAKLQNVGKEGDAFARDADAWVKLGEKARRDARAEAWEKSFGLALDGIKEYNKAVVELKESQLADYKAWFANQGEAMPASLKSVFADRIRGLRTTNDVINMLQYIADQHARAYEVAKSLEEEHLWEASGQAIAGVLKLSLKLGKFNPAASMAVDDFELIAADANGWYTYAVAKGRMDQLQTLRDQELRAVKRLGDRYVADVDAMKKLPAVRDALRNNSCPAP